MRIAPLLLLPFLTTPLSARDVPVADPAALRAAVAAARPGDRLLLAEGEWRDASIVFSAKGTAEAPIVLKAAKPGRTVLTGRSTLRIGGEHLVAEGLFFRDPEPGVELIEFRVDSKTPAKHCRLTDCAVLRTLPPSPADRKRESRWVGLYGTGNRVERCSFAGKPDAGALLVVWLRDGEEAEHHIEKNYFGPRERLGKNGGETIRVGDSRTSMLSARCVVEKNLFERCDGEAECVSNKSCGNVYRDNAFLEVAGTLTLRHGNGCLVERNVFLGGGAAGTGGVRIIGEDHVVRGNYFERLTGDDARSALCFMTGIPNSPANGYFQVQRARVEGNAVVDCKHPLLIGLADDPGASLPPVAVEVVDNRISSPKSAVVEARCPLAGFSWKGNRFHGRALGMPPVEGVEYVEPKIVPVVPVERDSVGTTWKPPAEDAR